MSKKSILSILLVLVLLCVLTTGLVACSGNKDKVSQGFVYAALSNEEGELIGYKITGRGTNKDKHVVLPSEYQGKPVLGLASSVFTKTKIKSIVIPDTITEIESGSFEACRKLNKVVLPSTLTYIGQVAFKECKSLKTIVIPEGVQAISDKTFIDSGIKHITLPSSVKSIGTSAFQNAKKLKSITLSDGIEKIGTKAFYACTNLKKINLPTSVKDIGLDAFYNCNKMDLEVYDGNLLYLGNWLIRVKPNNPLVTGGTNNKIKTANLKETTYGICSDAFYWCVNLESINIPDSVVVIGDGAFKDCASLKEININSTSKLERIGSYAFANNISLEKIFVPNTVNYIGDRAFLGCEKTKITVDNADRTVANLFHYRWNPDRAPTTYLRVYQPPVEE